jgi:hypothetical protein
VRGGGAEVDELDRDQRSWDFAGDDDRDRERDRADRSDRTDRSGVRALATDDPPRRRRRIDPDEDDE